MPAATGSTTLSTRKEQQSEVLTARSDRIGSRAMSVSKVYGCGGCLFTSLLHSKLMLCH